MLPQGHFKARQHWAKHAEAIQKQASACFRKPPQPHGGHSMTRNELHRAAVDEFERALASRKHLLETKGKRTLTVKITTTRIPGGYRIAGTCLANGKKHFSFGSIITDNPEEL
jgi:hypothetical protein